MTDMLGIAALVSCGAAAACLYLGLRLKDKAKNFNSFIRVQDLNWLDDLHNEKTTNLLVVVSGKVGSVSPFNSTLNGRLAVYLEEKAKLDLKIKLDDGELINKSLSHLLRQKETTWCLEDSTGQVNIVGAQFAEGFDNILNNYVIDVPAKEILKKLVIPEGSKVLAHGFHGRALNIGTFLTFVGEAVRDKAGVLMIQRPKEQPFMVFRGEASFDKMVNDIKTNSEDCIRLSQILFAIAVSLAFVYGVSVIRRAFFPFKWEKEDKSEETKSDSAEID